MCFQALFRLLKWIITGDARTILAQKHDTRPVMILLRLMIVIAAVVGLVGLVVVIDRHAQAFNDIVDAHLLFIPAVIALILLVLAGVLAKILLEKLYRWIGAVIRDPGRLPGDVKALKELAVKELKENPFVMVAVLLVVVKLLQLVFVGK